MLSSDTFSGEQVTTAQRPRVAVLSLVLVMSLAAVIGAPLKSTAYPTACDSAFVSVALAYADLYDCESDFVTWTASGGCPRQVIAYNDALFSFMDQCGQIAHAP